MKGVRINTNNIIFDMVFCCKIAMTNICTQAIIK